MAKNFKKEVTTNEIEKEVKKVTNIKTPKTIRVLNKEGNISIIEVNKLNKDYKHLSGRDFTKEEVENFKK